MSLQHCTDCDFSSNTSLWNHKNSVHVGTIFSCQECAYTSRSKHGLKHHVKAKHEDNIHKCQECGKAFSYVGDLNRHKRAIHEGIVFTCKYCSHTEKRKRVLAYHEQYAHLERDTTEHVRKEAFPCPVCKKTFKRKHHLKRHYLSHSEEKPFGCLTCDKRFSDRSNLATQETIHNEKSQDERSFVRFPCMQCSKDFSRKNTLSLHIRNNHTKDASLFCTACNQYFANYESHKDHMENHKIFPCKKCEKDFPRNKSLQRHMRSAHR